MSLMRYCLLCLLLFCTGLSFASAGELPSEARQLTLRFLQDRDCGEAAMAAFPESEQRFEVRLAETQPAQAQAAARAERAAALARRSADCAGLKHIVSSTSIMADPESNKRLGSAALQGDPLALLLAQGSTMDGNSFRRLAAQLIDSGDAEAIARIGRVLATRQDRDQFGIDRANLIVADTWLLLACEFGLDCGAGSRAVDHFCLARMVCGYPDLAAAIRASRGEEGSAQIVQSRDELLQRIRQRGGASLFPTYAGGS
ncbi:MAG: hypothetical protein AB7E72_09940 [Lysobacterales bacterium]